MPAPLLDEYSAYEAINVSDFGDGRHLGILEPTATAQGFRYSKDVWFTIPFSAFGGGLLGTGTAFVTVRPEFTIRIRDTIDPASRIVFEQTVTLPIQATLQPAGGGVGFAFWSPLDAQVRIETSIVENLAVPLGPHPGSTNPSDPQDHHQGWPYVDTENPTAFSENTFFLDFNVSDTFIFTAVGMLVRLTYYSPPYRVNIAPGAIFDAVRDTAGIGRLDKEATYKISYKLSAEIARWLDHNSLLHLGIPGTINDARGVEIFERTMRRGENVTINPLSAKAFVSGVAQPHLTKMRDATLMLLGRDAGRAGVLYESHDDGLTFERTKWKTDGQETEVIVFGTGYNMLDQMPCPHGGLYQLGEKGGVLYLQRFPQPFAQNRQIGAARTGQVYRLGVPLGRTADGTLYVTSAAHQYVSSDEFDSPAQEQEV